MATTTGLVQRLSVFGTSQACVWLGPTPTDTDLLIVTNDGSTADSIFASTTIETLAAAMMHRREVNVGHGATGSQITSVRIDPT